MLRNNADARAWATCAGVHRHYHESSDPFKNPLPPPPPTPESIDHPCHLNRNLKSGVSSETTTPAELYIFLN